MNLADDSMRLLIATVAKASLGEACRVLQKGLEFAPSVYVAACPEQGFAWLSRWSRQEHPLYRRIVAANLRKARLQKRYMDHVEVVGELLLTDNSY